jgi:UDP-glucose:glycoprotein glucosyltransferase
LLQIRAFADPLSERGQLITSLAASLAHNSNFDVALTLNPHLNIDELPLKRFYKFIFNPTIKFDDAGSLAETGKALFKTVPPSPVFTLGVVDTPEAWLVESSFSDFDLDNLKLENLGDASTLYVEYTLDQLLFSGHCFDHETSQPTAGLKLKLESLNSGVVKDTLVMQNLGYFQLQSNPGVWILDIAGNHGKVYQFSSKFVQPNPVIISTFHPHSVPIRVSRLSGMETANLADFNDDDFLDSTGKKGFWNKVTSLFGSQSPSEGNDKEFIHVFSLASGHLYERFLKIMMLSVVKNTKEPVKFWFIRQFLSPQFKKEIGPYAKSLGENVEVELVTYKWPHWLRRQTEKQRTIWGYKILFLDVVFPLKVPRIIFVDADQVVRSDLKELWDLNLRGAPYAYTPFCDSNRDTEGFRFWKQGYWRDHLRGKPYHISALYVVDLLQFRKMRAGDDLRVVYDQLSADKNSLANLDQDLPNFAQHQVPIYSLPQEWLWCETWCAMDTLSSAKTIDLVSHKISHIQLFLIFSKFSVTIL